MTAFLGWVVLVVPVLLGTVVVFMPEGAKNALTHKRWKFGLLIITVIYSGIVGWWQVRSEREAAQDRDKAVGDTADRVAKRTTEDVTQALARQYGRTITAMAQQLVEQGRKVERIGQSDILTGKKPVRVVVANPTPSEAPLDIHVSRLSATPDPTRGKNAVQFILTTNKVMNGARIELTCTQGRINDGIAELPGAGATSSAGAGVRGGHTYLSGIMSPNWSPDFPLLITLYFDGDLGVCSFRPLR
jgi:hypothetical protein